MVLTSLTFALIISLLFFIVLMPYKSESSNDILFCFKKQSSKPSHSCVRKGQFCLSFLDDGSQEQGSRIGSQAHGLALPSPSGKSAGKVTSESREIQESPQLEDLVGQV